MNRKIGYWTIILVITGFCIIDQTFASVINNKLSANPVSGGGVQDFRISPDDNWVVYLADQDEDEVKELYSVQANGSNNPVKLNAELVENGDVNAFKISSDSNRVIYFANQDTDSMNELYSVPIDGSETPVKLNLSLSGSEHIQPTFEVSTDSSRVVYSVDGLASFNIYSVPVSGTVSPVKLNTNGPAAIPLGISPDGSYVMYWGIQGAMAQMYRTSIDGTGQVITLTNHLTLTLINSVFQFCADGNDDRVIYHTIEQPSTSEELFSVPVNGSSYQTKLSNPLVDGRNVFYYICSPDGNWVIYFADQDIDNLDEMFSVPADGNTPAVKLNNPLNVGDRIFDFTISPNSKWVTYIENGELYGVPIDRSTVPQKLNAPLVSGGQIEGMIFTSDSRYVVYWGDQDVQNQVDFYKTPIDVSQPVKLNGVGEQFSDVRDVLSRADNTWIVYRARDVATGIWQLYSTSLDGTRRTERLNGLLASGGNVTKSSGYYHDHENISYRVAYLADQDTNGVTELYTSQQLMDVYLPVVMK